MRTIPRRGERGSATRSTGTATARDARAGRTADAASGAGATSAPGATGPAQAASREQAAALHACWSGDPAVVVSSPPGAGKTALVTNLAHQLTSRANLDVAIAAQTRAQAVDVAARVAATGAATTLLVSKHAARPRGLPEQVTCAAGLSQVHGRRQVVVTTTARWLHTRGVERLADVLIVDEGWQMTYADLGGLGVIAQQVVLVGDPGQIAPVVTAPTRRWARSPVGPHLPAPDALCATAPDQVTRLRLPYTYRLGPVTAGILAPFYADPFTSRRAPSTVHVVAGADPNPGTTALPPAEPEIAAHVVDTPPDTCSPALLDAAIGRVRTLLDAGVLQDGTGRRRLTEEDVALVVPHRTQAAHVQAAFARRPGVLVGTINALQGLERHAVVVVHPLAGRRDAPEFGVEPARLCVALSRHRSHASVITDSATPDVLARALAVDPSDGPARLHRDVLAQLGVA